MLFPVGGYKSKQFPGSACVGGFFRNEKPPNTSATGLVCFYFYNDCLRLTILLKKKRKKKYWHVLYAKWGRLYVSNTILYVKWCNLLKSFPDNGKTRLSKPTNFSVSLSLPTKSTKNVFSKNKFKYFPLM